MRVVSPSRQTRRSWTEVVTALWVWFELARLRRLFTAIVWMTDLAPIRRSIGPILDRIPYWFLAVHRPMDLPEAAQEATRPAIEYSWVGRSDTLESGRLADYRGVYRLCSVTVDGEAGQIFTGANTIVPGLRAVERPYIGLRNSSVGRYQVFGRLVGQPRREVVRTLESACFAISRWPSNWYHFVLDTLGSLAVLQQEGLTGSNPLLVSREVAKIPSMMEAIRAVAPESELVLIGRDEAVAVHDLWVASPPSIILPSLVDRGRGWNGRAVPKYGLEALVRVREGVLAAFNRSVTGGGHRLLLSRDPRLPDPRSLQPEQLEHLTSELELTPTDLAALTFQSQIDRITNADVVAGATGAAWVNILFCRPGTKGLILIDSDEVASRRIWPPLFDIAGVDILQVPSHWRFDSRTGRRYLHADQQELLRAVRRIRDVA